MSSVAASSSVVERYLGREPLTQALAYAAILQARGIGCVLAGAAFVLLQHRRGALIARMQRPRQLDLHLIGRIVDNVGPSQVLVEPAAAGALVEPHAITRWRFERGRPCGLVERMTTQGWRTTARAFSHTKTRVLDLLPGIDAVVAQMSPVARRNVRGAQADGVDYESRPFADVQPDDLRGLRAVHDRFLAARPHLEDDWDFRDEMIRQFGGSGDLIMGHEAGRMVGAVYMPRHDGVAHYYAVVTSGAARSRKLGTGLVLTALKTAIARGCDLFDFVGVRDERYPDRNARWDGFSRFKERFGGVDVFMPPSLEWMPASA
ncbi:MAG: GNAT family N-acetyltransferase [Myxococcota bacterium]